MSKLNDFKPYPAYKDSGLEWPEKIPARWAIKRLKYVAHVEAGQSPPSELVSDGFEGLPFLQGNADFGARIPTPRQVCDSAPKRAQEGDILMSVRAPVGAMNVADRAYGIGRGLCAVRHRHGLDAEFGFYALALMRFRLDMVATGSTYDAVSTAHVGDLPTPIPLPREQRVIARFLDRETARIDALIAKKERLITLLQEKRAALITRAVTEGLEPTASAFKMGSEVFPRISQQWEMRKLRHLITQVKRPIAVDSETEYQEIGIRSWGHGVFHKEPVKGAILEEKKVFKIEPGDLVLNIVFAWEGAVAVAGEAERGMIGSHRFPTFRVSEDVDRDYLLMVLQTRQGRWLMAVNSPGAAGRNRTIRINQFMDELIPLPPMDTQRELIRRVRSEEKRFATLVLKLQDALTALKELRTALISAAVTGKIDVREEVV